MGERDAEIAREVISLREYIESRLASMQRAVDKAEEATERRFSSVNEMRAMVTDAARMFMPRSEYEAAHRAVQEKVEALQKMLWIGTGVVIAFQFLIGVMLIFWKKV